MDGGSSGRFVLCGCGKLVMDAGPKCKVVLVETMWSIVVGLKNILAQDIIELPMVITDSATVTKGNQGVLLQ